MGFFDKVLGSVKDSFSKGDAGVADGLLGLFKGKPKGEAGDGEAAEAGGEETESGFGDIAKSFKSKG